MERVTRKITQLNVMFGTYLDNTDGLFFTCICGFVYDGEAISCDSIALRSFGQVSSRRYVKDCISSLKIVYPDIPIQVSMTTNFTNEYFDDLNTLY